MNDWPHDEIYAAALAYIRKHAVDEPKWRFTRIDALSDALARIVRLDAGERVIVSCSLDAQRWFVMTTARVFGIVRGSQFSFSPLDVTRWRWGPEVATLAMTSGTHLRIPYETGPASAALTSYAKFWSHVYPTLS
jgi:hypothetical protein